MAGEYISFESVPEWNHLQISEELFRAKHQEPLLEYKKEINTLMRDVQKHLSFVDDISKRSIKSEAERVSNTKILLHQSREERDRLKCDILEFSDLNGKMKHTCSEMNERLKTLEHEAQELMQLKKAFATEVKSTYNAFILAKDYYKDKLKMYFSIEGSSDAEEITVLVEFFTSKRKKESKYSVTIGKVKSTDKCRLVNMKPKLKIFSALSKRLEETNDISGLLCCVRKCFINLQSQQ